MPDVIGAQQGEIAVLRGVVDAHLILRDADVLSVAIWPETGNV
jgi:hypothetical protein